MQPFRPVSLSVPLLLATIGGVLVPDSRAQCGLQWQLGAPASGPAGTVWASAVLPNGDLVAGGDFALADAAPAANIARWDGNFWQPLGDGLDGVVHALAVLPNGDLVAGGSFRNSGSTQLHSVARWNGSSWSAIGSGLIGTVRAIQTMPNGDIVIGGSLSVPGSTVNDGMARWNGSAWSAIGPGLFTGTVHSIARLSNGDLLFGGLFASLGPGPVQNLARWDGVRWTQERGLGVGSTVAAILALPLGQYALAGTLSIDGISTSVARFDGTALVALAPPPGTFSCLTTDHLGNLFAGGSLVAGGGVVARFDGSQWTLLPAGAPQNTLSLRVEPTGGVLACGSAGMSGGLEGSSVRRFDGVSWTLLGRPQPPRIDALVQLPGGDIVAGGAFSSLGGTAAANIARWNGSQWSPLGQGTDGPVTSLAADEHGNIVVSGSFTRAGGSAANRIAMWTGSAWSTLGNGLPSPANRLAINGQGEVMASGFDNVVRWFAGGRWTPFTPLLVVTSILADANGDFLFGGVSATPPLVAVVRFSAGTTSPEPSGLILARSLVRLRDGSIVAGGNGVQGSNIVRLQGGTWAPFSAQWFPTSTVVAVTELANGQVLAAGAGSPMLLARYDGSAWVTVGSVERMQQAPVLAALAASSRGEVCVAGQFEYVDGVQSVGFARATPRCPAAAVPVGAGCFGGGGPVSLAAQTLPWAGATFHAIASGIAMPSVALHVAGIVPVSQPLPLGAPGCTLHVDPLFVELLLPTAARLPVALPVPDHPAILGQTLRSQVGLLELSATGGIVRATSTNALQLQVGAF